MFIGRKNPEEKVLASESGYAFIRFPTKTRWKNFLSIDDRMAGETPAQSKSAQSKSPAKPATTKPTKKVAHIRIDREEDEDGAFFVAYLFQKEKPTDFLTFGSRNKKIALKMAQENAKKLGFSIGSLKAGEPPFED